MCWKIQCDSSVSSLFRLNPDVAAERLHDAIAEDHSPSVAAVVCVHRDGVDQEPIQNLRWYSGAVVGNADLRIAIDQYRETQRWLGLPIQGAQRIAQDGR